MDGSNVDCLIIGPKQASAEERSLMRASTSALHRVDSLNYVPYGGAQHMLLDVLSLLNSGREEPARDHEFRDGYLTVNEIPALASLVLATHLKNQGFTSDIIHSFDFERKKFDDAIAARPKVVAITTTLYTDPTPIREIVRAVRAIDREAKIIVGGPYVLNRWNRSGAAGLKSDSDFIGADYYVIDSAGEEVLSALLASRKRASAGRSLLKTVDSTLQNVAFVTKEGLQVGPIGPTSPKINGCGVDWSLFSPDVLGATVNFRTARGCAFKCSYCNYPVLAGKISLAEIDDIERELAQMAESGDIRYVAFIDDTFNVPANRFKELCRMLARRDFGFRWVSYLRCDSIERDTVQLLRDSGCAGVFLGLESGDDTVLDCMNKRATVSGYRRGIEVLNRYGIITFGTFIAGFPGETDETVENTAAFIRDVGLDFYRVGLWYGDTSTPIYKQQERFQIRGEAYSWSHATMDATRASEAIWSLFIDDRNPPWLIESLGFWGLTYLLGKGFDTGKITSILRDCRQLMLLRDRADEDARGARAAHLDSLRDVVRAVPYGRTQPREPAGLPGVRSQG